MMTNAFRLLPLLLLAACGSTHSSAPASATADADGASDPDTTAHAEETMTDSQPHESAEAQFEKSDAEWREQLTPEEYRVTRQAGTERAFSGRYWDTKTAGTYHCVCCDTPLFRSDAKFESGCGWPSFFEPLEGAKLLEVRDTTHGMVRTEIRCSRCDAHLGHVFPDGPPPTGLRYCINSVSLRLDPEPE